MQQETEQQQQQRERESCNGIDDVEMYVKKRNGQTEQVSFDKVMRRLQTLSRPSAHEAQHSLSQLNVGLAVVAQKVVSQIYSGVTTSHLDELAAQTCSSMSIVNPAYGELASRLVVSNHHKNTFNSFQKTMETLHTSRIARVSRDTCDVASKYAEQLDATIDYSRDYLFDYFGFKTLTRGYMLNNKDSKNEDVGEGDRSSVSAVVCERPQHMWMRVAIGIHGDDLTAILRCYEDLSLKRYTHATPTLFNSGTTFNQLASCFLIAMKSDSIDGIFTTLSDCAQISKHSGGIGVHIHNIRARGAKIQGTNGTSNGITPMLRVFNDTARYVDQGGGKRNGSFAVYLEPWHPDVAEFMDLRKNHGDEQMRARDLFYGLWVPDEFMRRVEADKAWTLMSPDTCPGLSDAWGEEFDRLYAQYEREGRGCRTVSARALWKSVLQAKTETGTPYVLYKDACNRKSNQRHLGTIKSSNLCTEIVEYSSPDETAVCNLASVSLPAMVVQRDLSKSCAVLHVRPDCIYCKLAKAWLQRLGMPADRVTLVAYETDGERRSGLEAVRRTYGTAAELTTFPQIVLDDEYVGGYEALVGATRGSVDYALLEATVRTLTRNLNRTIDRTYYPIATAETSNRRHRPIGIGVQGLADMFMLLRMPFDSAEAAEVNRRVFATMYYAAMSESVELARRRKQTIDELVALAAANSIDARTDRRAWTVGALGSSSPSMAPVFDCLDRGDDPGTDPDVAWTRYAWRARELLATIEPQLEHESLEFLCGQYGGAHASMAGSPLSEGLFQFDLWDGVTRDDRYDWDALRAQAVQYGARNSLLLAPMPTASTSQILGNTECFEPITTNVYVRRTLAGEFIVLNTHLLRDLIEVGLWTTELKEKLIYNDGSVQSISEIPGALRSLYKTAWDIKQRVLIDMAADRGAYVCQSQSMNLFTSTPTESILNSMLFYAWKRGLKTGMYYLRTKAATKAQQFTLDAEKYGCTNCSA